MNILISGVGGPTPRSIVYALKKSIYGEEINFFGTDNNPLSMGLYQKDLFSKTFLIPHCTSDTYWEEIEIIVAKEKIDLAIVQPELEVLEWSKRRVNNTLPCACLLPEMDIVELLIDKSKITDLLKNLGVVPKSYTFPNKDQDLSPVFEALGEDFWVRSTKGTSGLGSLRVTSRNSLANWMFMNKEVGEFIASTYLPGRNLACKLFFWEGKLIRSAVAERVNYIMAKISPSGVTGNTSFGRLINEPEIVTISILAMETIFKHVNSVPNGFFTIDLKEDENGIPFITEINVRHVAFTQCFAACGANFMEDYLRIYMKDPSFNFDYKMYEFEEGLIFLRDVDTLPIIMNEKDLITRLE
jgi:carbamoyl-phosphate synthase large subunit